MDYIKVLAHAKINLSLDITGKLDNGYHELQMILQTISLHDEVFIEKTDASPTAPQQGSPTKFEGSSENQAVAHMAIQQDPHTATQQSPNTVMRKMPPTDSAASSHDQGLAYPSNTATQQTPPTPTIAISCAHPYVPCDERNICYTAAKEFFNKTGIKNGSVNIKINKNIPVGAGLAGGSTNAAAVLKGLNALYNAGLTMDELAKIGLKCGADVPYCLHGGTYLAEGIGEKLTRLSPFNGINAVMVMPNFSVSTRWVYKNYSIVDQKKHPNTKVLIAAIKDKDTAKVAQGMSNVLESVTTVKYPEIKEIKHMLKEFGALGSMMSGSGPAVFGLFKNEQTAASAFNDMKKLYKRVYLVKTTDGGEIYGEDI